MSKSDEFVEIIKSTFPDDRLTSQKGIPTFHPESAEEAAQLFKLANEHAQQLYITGYGNNIDPIGERFDNIIVIRTDRLNKLIELAPEDFYVTVGGGYPLRELNQHLQEHKLWFPHAALPYVGSVGGAISVGLAADLHKHDLPIKKYFIKATIVTPEGNIIKPGSVCFKSVSGYDVVKLFSPSWGLLGLVISATFRVMPESGKIDFATMAMKAVERGRFLEAYDKSNPGIDAEYVRKIRAKFDPRSVLPIV
jgi:FAD/FMN-containing dehydrogenase